MKTVFYFCALIAAAIVVGTDIEAGVERSEKKKAS